MRIAFDLGGCCSKFPDIFKPLILALMSGHTKFNVEVFYISDMHPVEKIIDVLQRNDFPFISTNVYSADYKTYGESCKAVLCKELGVDILIDDFIGYVAEPGYPPVRLLVMPDNNRTYFHPSWLTSGEEGDFGRKTINTDWKNK